MIKIRALIGVVSRTQWEFFSQKIKLTGLTRLTERLTRLMGRLTGARDNG